MSIEIPEHLPNYQALMSEIEVLDLPFSASEIHGIICGYLCAGAIGEGEHYLRALTNNSKDPNKKEALLALFSVFAISHQQLLNFNFDFELLLPEEEQPLMDRAQAFSEWCEGFTQGITMAGLPVSQLQEVEAVEAIRHISEFAQLDYEALQVGDDDERALLEVSEYTRLAVLQIFNEVNEHLNSENSH